MTSKSDTHTAPDAAQILRKRAQELARPSEDPEPSENVFEVLEFSLANERYAVETRFVREVLPLKELTPLPCTPPFVTGIVNVRGQILPVFNLKNFFDLPEQGLTDLHRIILIRHMDIEVGFLTDMVVDVRFISKDSLQPSLPTLTGIRSDYLKGVTAEMLIVLEIANILQDPKIIIHEEVAG